MLAAAWLKIHAWHFVLSRQRGQTEAAGNSWGNSLTMRLTAEGMLTFSPMAHARRLTEIVAISENCGV
ncbi:hypothetical protein FACS1894140_1820 [Spirochaetia bacterium]|nr:hypothetical protein FACS1894140_1820 [Spirochaetia bacterium]